MAQGTVWFTGLSGAGKTTVAQLLAAWLEDASVPVHTLDGDDLREGLSADLGFSEEDRRENIRRVGEVALLVAKLGHLCLVTLISPFTSDRANVRARHGLRDVPFVEVYVSTPLEVCERRDPKGLYKRARRGEIELFTGISSPYEEPEAAEIVLRTEGRTPVESANEVLLRLGEMGLVVPVPVPPAPAAS